jgi:hypothetical protein
LDGFATPKTILDECIKMCVFLIPCIPRIYEDIMQIKNRGDINHSLNKNLTFVNVKLEYL